MGLVHSPKIVNAGLVLHLDSANSNNLSNFNNMFENGSFRNGSGMPAESGSNPTNTIISLANPGDSSFVLQQNGNNTEYQLNLSNLLPNTTYVMSGWYAKSADYNSSDTMFHSRAFSSSGNHSATGTGIGTTIKTVVVNNITWRYCYAIITTPSDADGEFDWYVGYGANNTAGFRYYTNLRFERGHFPSLKNLSSTNISGVFQNGVSFNNDNGGSIVFNGLNGYGEISPAAPNAIAWTPLGSVGQSTITFEFWIKTTDNTGFILSKPWNGNGGYNYEITCSSFKLAPIHLDYELYNTISFASSVNTGTPTQLVCWANAATFGYSIDGGRVTGSASHGFTSDNPYNRANNQIPGALMTLFPYGSGWSGSTGLSLEGNVYSFRVYNRALSAQEIRQNFNALRGRFGI